MVDFYRMPGDMWRHVLRHCEVMLFGNCQEKQAQPTHNLTSPHNTQSATDVEKMEIEKAATVT